MCFDRVCRRAVVAGLLLLFTLASCTVKEDRDHCPCLLTLELQDLPEWPVYYSVLEDGQVLYEGTAPHDTTIAMKVPRTGVEVRALAGSPGNARIPYGDQSPPLYLYRRQVETQADGVKVRPQLRKHFCTLSLEVNAPPGNGTPYWTQVRGQVDGIDPDGKPLSGDFACRLVPGGQVRLPRQHPSDALWLDIVMPDGILRTFSLGACILESGYDWTAPDLTDLSLELQLSVSLLRLQWDGWSRSVPLSLEI